MRNITHNYTFGKRYNSISAFMKMHNFCAIAKYIDEDRGVHYLKAYKKGEDRIEESNKVIVMASTVREARLETLRISKVRFPGIPNPFWLVHQ